MAVIAALGAIFLISAVLWDGFETIVLPHRVSQPVSLTQLFYRATWVPFSAVARRIRDGGRRETFLSFYGPLSLIMLLGIWAADLVIGFAILQWAFGSQMRAPDVASVDFWTGLYVSGVTFFTLGFGDVVPVSPLSRTVSVVEAGLGFGFLAIVIGYLPVLYQAFSRREVSVSLLDARAGSPPSAIELLRRHGQDENMDSIKEFLRDWEQWSAELLESHLSYPVLGYFRSQHEHQSWLASLTMILDVCAFIIADTDCPAVRQARLTFAMARHAAVDLSNIFNTVPRPPSPDRLSQSDLDGLRLLLWEAGVSVCRRGDFEDQLTGMRGMYEPYVSALSGYLLMTLPPWLPPSGASDAWQTTAWERPALSRSVIRGRGSGLGEHET